MRRFLKENGLTVFCLGLFLAAVVVQGLVGWHDFNNDQLRHQGDPISLGRYLVSSEFGVALLENWQSEYLQFTLYILGTVWLLQRGSPESKELDQAGSSRTSTSAWARTQAPARRAGRGPGDCARRSTRTRCCW